MGYCGRAIFLRQTHADMYTWTFIAPYVCSNALYHARMVLATTRKVWSGAQSRIGVLRGVIAQDAAVAKILLAKNIF